MSPVIAFIQPTQVMLLLIGVDGLALLFTAVFLKWFSDIDMLQVAKTLMMKILDMTISH